jgi:hypothetical protein
MRSLHSELNQSVKISTQVTLVYCMVTTVTKITIVIRLPMVTMVTEFLQLGLCRSHIKFPLFTVLVLPSVGN